MNKTNSSILTIAAIIIGLSLPSCSSIKPTNKPNPQLESLRNENKTLKQQLSETTNELNAIKAEANSKKNKGKYPLEIDAMLNIEDTTIFNSHFKQFDIKTVHPRSREMYQWVSTIHELAELLQQIEESHASIEQFNANLTNLPPSTIRQLESLNSSIKENIRTADKLRENIELSYNDMKEVFTLGQMDYYNNLVDQLNNYINLYF